MAWKWMSREGWAEKHVKCYYLILYFEIFHVLKG
jgi:hypothetical protein